MQQGHPRHKQLSRARHEMYLHNRHKSLVGVAAISSLFAHKSIIRNVFYLGLN